MTEVKEKTEKFYVVWRGKKPGIYTTWSDCKEQVEGYKNAHFKSFDSMELAELAMTMTYRAFKSLQDFMTKAGMLLIYKFNQKNKNNEQHI